MNSIKEEVTLLPCPNPWCDGVGELWVERGTCSGELRSSNVRCDGCDNETPYYDTEEEAITAWNTRDPDLMAKAEGLEAKVNEAREVLSVFARIADMEHRADLNDSVMVNVKHCRKAREIVTEWDQSQ